MDSEKSTFGRKGKDQPRNRLKNSTQKRYRKRKAASYKEKDREEEDLEIRAEENPKAEIEEIKGESLEERLRDQQERDGLARRLLKKDLDHRKERANNVSAAESAAYDEEVKRRGLLEMTVDERLEFLPETREFSRVTYLDKRQKQQLELARRRVADEERFFGDVQVSSKERIEFEKTKDAIRFAEEREKLKKIEDEEYYSIPKSIFVKASREAPVDLAAERRKLLHKRYKPDEEEVTDITLFESEKIRIATDQRELKYKDFVAEDSALPLLEDEDQLELIRREILKGRRPEAELEKPEIGLEEIKQAKMRTLHEVRESLPIFSKREEFLALIERQQILIVVGETGSGKTTQIPQYLHEAGYTKGGKKIGVTQPRRVAAMSVAARVSDELGTKIGREAGYSIRFEDCTSDATVIKYMTDGMLLREFLGEPDLESYSVVVIDEAHERTLHTDVLFGLVKDVARYRPDLKLIISSATLDTAKFSKYFDDAPVFSVEGRLYDVNIFYAASPQANYIDAAVVTVMQIHLTQPPGDILVFLTGQEEIEEACEEISARTRKLGSKASELIVCPIYSTLPADQQRRIFYPTPEGARKVVVATNIAETSLTIDGVVFVIDCGFCKQNNFNPRTGMDSLLVAPISKASAEQRAGRAGRVQPGKCFRLYTKYSYEKELEVNPVPEIQRSNLGGVVLMLKSLGVDDLLHFDFVDPPPAEGLIRALEQLYALGALNSAGDLTKLGRRMAEFPIDPMMSKMLILSAEFHCSEEVLRICAMLGVSNSLMYRPKEQAINAERAHKMFHRKEGDHFMLLNIYQQWEETEFSAQWCFENYIQVKSMRRARDVKEQLETLLERVEVDLESNYDPVAISKAIVSGYFFNTALLSKTGNYKTYKFRQTVAIHPSSVLKEELPRWVVFHEFILTSKKFIRTAIKIEPKWLLEVAPHLYKSEDIKAEMAKKLPKIRNLKKNDFF